MSGKPKNLSQAIDDLEYETATGAGDFQSRIKSEFQKIEETLASLRPHLDKFSDKMGDEAKNAKSKVESKVQENPWATLGLVGLIGFILGFLFATKTKRGE